MSKLLSESTSVPVKTSIPGRWSAVFLTEGEGSSGNWLRETIERDGPTALPKGSKCFITHNRLENGEPDPFRMWATLAEDAYYDGNGQLVGEIDILPSWRDRVEEVAPHTALSVYLMGEVDANNNITSIIPDVQNGVDLVVHPGRPGSSLVEKLYESAILAGSEKKPSTTVVREERNNMELEAKVDKALEILAGLVAEKSAQDVAKVQAEADETAVTNAIEAYDAAVKAVEEADLFKSQRGAILAEAKKGADVTSLIETAKSVKAEALEAVALQEETAGRVITSDSKGFSLAKIAEAR